MEMSASFRPPEEELLSDDCLGSSLDEFDFVVGQQVHVMAGPLAGLAGVTHRQAHDGGWIIELDDMAPGVFLCIDAEKLAYG